MDSQSDQMTNVVAMDSKFIGSTTLLTDLTKSKSKSRMMSQKPGTSSSTSQVQLTLAAAKIPMLSAGDIQVRTLGTKQATLARLLISRPKLKKFNFKSQELTRSTK
uniref:Uncharacterized protein n=1 Tax=Romanomermis culicivorax TaxID=13658 RepID=A0A915K6I2_ROMCU